jgi:hypothetical protein
VPRHPLVVDTGETAQLVPNKLGFSALRASLRSNPCKKERAPFWAPQLEAISGFLASTIRAMILSRGLEIMDRVEIGFFVTAVTSAIVLAIGWLAVIL